MKNSFDKFREIQFLLLALFGLGLFSSCALQPLAWQPPLKPAFEGKLELNTHLQNARKIDLAGWYGPEDIIMDQLGNIYCGVHKGESDFSDGKILKITPEGKVEIFYDAGSWVAGLHLDTDGDLIALSHREGLIRINAQKEVKVLADRDEQGRKFMIPNGLDLASDGSIYFSNTSHHSAYTIEYGRKLILEMKPQGALYRYHPGTQTITTLIDGTYFGNGVVLSKNEDYLLLTETTHYRILRYWLKGERSGEVEVFMDNLPGFPNGISLREDGSFWLGFTALRNDALDDIHPSKTMKKLFYALPDFMQPQQEKFGMVLNISEEGEILNALFDPGGQQIPEAGSVKEYNGNLYIGGDIVPYISTVPIKDDHSVSN